MPGEVVVDTESAERAELAECLRVIREGEQTFIRVGEALRTVQHKGLFRYTHEDFKSWCRDHLPWSYRRAQQLMEASIDGKAALEVCARKTNNLFVTIPQVNEGTMRELQSLPPPRRAEAFELALESGAKRLTAKVIRSAVETVQRRPPPLPPAPPPAGKLRESVRAALDRVGEFTMALGKLAEFRAAAEALWKDGNLGAFLNPQEIEGLVDGLKRCLRSATPYSDCVYCGQVGCSACRSVGWLPRHVFESAPEERRKASAVKQ